MYLITRITPADIQLFVETTRSTAVQLETGEHLLKIKYDTFKSGEKKFYVQINSKTNYFICMIIN